VEDAMVQELPAMTLHWELELCRRARRKKRRARIAPESTYGREEEP
jgi:hypothetical protein